MKRMSVVMIALGLAVSMSSIASAGYKNGKGRGCGNCPQAEVVSEPYVKFQADTIDLRQEMMNKRFEIQRENLKATPDKEKVISLQADTKVLQKKIMDIRAQSGLPVNKCDGECGPRRGGPGMKGLGKGMGNNGPCMQK